MPECRATPLTVPALIGRLSGIDGGSNGLNEKVTISHGVVPVVVRNAV